MQKGQLLKHMRSCVLGVARDARTEVRSRLVAANRKYFSLQKYFKSCFATKIQLYKTEVQPVAMYGTKCWTLSGTNEKVLHVFERKILHRIYGQVQDKGQWKSR
jgi:hypothetical protein